jgi:hypothetical protein
MILLRKQSQCSAFSFVLVSRVTTSRRIRLSGHVARIGDIRKAYNILVGKSEEKRPLGRPRGRWKENI